MSSELCLVSGSDIFREGLTHILESEGFVVTQSVERVRDLINLDRDSDQLLLLDCPSLEKQAERVEMAKQRYPAMSVVVLSDEYDPKVVIECFNAGVQGYIIKSSKSDRIVAAFRLVALGEKVIPSDLVDLIGGRGFDYHNGSDAEREVEMANLSPREVEVLCCLMAGFPNKVIARHLDVCEATVKVHVKAILRKLNVRNRTQAALWANSRGIREPMIAA
ncbi:response regulator transcription factor [Qipengyuania soli]|uniref:Response regulator transcription factor n=1 Tax=Qipengyuania soli TaxID=2782568 RepID=A0A7S8IV50_9SPHN|nr:response regulator transcription factor [Qipengyuania soli]QPC99135.1 response regulator transcription factor [Qipengyuania soli]